METGITAAELKVGDIIVHPVTSIRNISKVVSINGWVTLTRITGEKGNYTISKQHFNKFLRLTEEELTMYLLKGQHLDNR